MKAISLWQPWGSLWLSGVHRDSIGRLAVRVGEGCSKLHGSMMRGLRVNRIELDEIWGFVAKKQGRVTPEDGDMVGDQYTFIALAEVVSQFEF